MVDLILVIAVAGILLFGYVITLHFGSFLETVQEEAPEIQHGQSRADRIQENPPEEKKE